MLQAVSHKTLSCRPSKTWLFVLICSSSLSANAQDHVYEKDGALSIEVTMPIDNPSFSDQQQARSMLTSGRLLNQYVQQRADDYCPSRRTIPMSTHELPVSVLENHFISNSDGDKLYIYKVAVDLKRIDVAVEQICDLQSHLQ